MSNILTNRRAFLATGAIAIPSIALAKGMSVNALTTLDGPFEDNMKQANDHLKSMRGLMRALERPGARADAAYLANQITILMAQCVEHAKDVHIPEASKAKYADNQEQFTTDLRIKMTATISAANSLSRALLMGNDEEANNLYNSLREERKEAHDEFKVDD